MLNNTLIERILLTALSNGASFAEIFMEDTYHSNIKLLDNKIKDSIVGQDYGAGIRVFYGKKAIYAYTNDLSEKSLISAAKAVSKAETGHNNITEIKLINKQINSPHIVKILANNVPKQDKIDLMFKVNKSARNYNQLISQVTVSISESIKNIMIANSNGRVISDTRNYSLIRVHSTATKDNEKQTAGEVLGRHAGFEFLLSIDPDELGKITAERAVKMILSDYAPSGKFPVVIDNGFGGVIFHEACGHSLETTSVAKGSSIFADKMGKQIANECVTAIDDGTIANEWGSTVIDDEGNLTQKTILIENGMLKSFMVDELGSLKTGYKPTGSGRRQSYKFAPTSRMRNTYIAKGNDSFEDMIASIDFGIYAKKMGGGSVQPGTGDFNFAVAEGYIIRKGKIAESVRGATLIGNGADILRKISMVSDNLAFAQGMCGSVSGSVPVCVGQPAIKVDEIVVGGR